MARRVLLSAGKGTFQAAPEETLKLALAGLEKKHRIQTQVAAWTAELAQFKCPPEIAALKDELLYARTAISRRLAPSNRRAVKPG